MLQTMSLLRLKAVVEGKVGVLARHCVSDARLGRVVMVVVVVVAVVVVVVGS